MIHGWQVLAASPDPAATPADVTDQWNSAVSAESPGTVAAMAPELAAVTDIDAHDWWVRATISVDHPSRLRFAGLTAPARVFLDGELAATCESMFLPVTVFVAAGTTRVEIVFGSMDQWLRTRRPRGRWRSSLVAAQGLRWARTTFLGRAPVYGQLPAPVGIWRPVEVLADVHDHRCCVTVDPARSQIRVDGMADPESPGPITIEVDDPNGDRIGAPVGVTVVDGRFDAEVPVADAQLWWPRGYGDQPRYRVRVLDTGRVVHESSVGFRVVTTRTDGGFTLVVNDVPIFARGVTWSPPDPVALQVEAEVLEHGLRALADIGVTMVRVVGGMVFEQPDFYRLCAELGILVWQDAMLATIDPPDEAADLICREMAELLRTHSGNPAIVVVSGGSETLQQPEMLGLDPTAMSLPLLSEHLPTVVAAHADVVYVPASPSSPGLEGQSIRPDLGVAHWFGVGGYLRPLDDVRSAGVRFAAESLAFSIPPAPESVDRHFGSASGAGHHPLWKSAVPRDRGSSWDFEDVRDHYVRELFGVDPAALRRTDPERGLQLGRAAVAEAMRTCFAFWRQGDSRCAGALVLTGRDLVPGAGWGIFDSDGMPKAPVPVLARVWAPTTVTIEDAGLSGLRVDVHHDGPKAIAGELVLVAAGPTGHVVAEATTPIEVAAHSTVTLYDSGITGKFADLSHAYRFGPAPADAVQVSLRVDGAEIARDVLVVVVRTGQVHTGLTARASQGTSGDWTLEVSAEVTLRYVVIEMAGWTPSDNWFHIVPGQPHRVHLTGAGIPTGRVTSVDGILSARIEVSAS